MSDGIVFHEIACGIHGAGDTAKSRFALHVVVVTPLWLLMRSNLIVGGYGCYTVVLTHRIVSYCSCSMLAGICRSWCSIVFGR